MNKPKLTPRSKPQQARSRSRVEHILDVTEKLVLEQGFDAITTNLVARESGVPVGTLYHYYSNKFAIFAAVVRRSFGELERKWAEQPPDDPANESVGEYFDRMLDMMAEHWRQRRAAMQLMSSLQHTPEMKPVADRYLKITSERNAATISHYFPDLPKERCRLIGVAMEEAGNALLNRLNGYRGKRREKFKEEMKAMIRAYLGTITGGS